MVLSYSNGCHVLLPTGPIHGRLEGVRRKTVVKRGFTIESTAKNQMPGALSNLARWRYSAFFSELAPDFLKSIDQGVRRVSQDRASRHRPPLYRLFTDAWLPHSN